MDAAVLMVTEAREILESELGVKMDWEEKAKAGLIGE